MKRKQFGLFSLSLILALSIFVTPLTSVFAEEGVLPSANTEGNDQKNMGQGLVNLALGKGEESFTLQMEGAGTDLDPATKDIAIKDKEKKILPRLTDGVFANGSMLDGNWNGTGERSKYYEAYRQIDRSIILDLGQISNINKVSLHMQEHNKYGISVPSVVSYFLSEDGVTYRRIGSCTRFEATLDKDPAHNSGDPECANYYFSMDGLNYNARYVKVSFELTGTWAFADELEVMGTAAPSDTAEALPNTPGTEYEVVNKYATTAQSNGIQHESLAYSGYWISSSSPGIKTSQKTVDELLPVVGFVDKDGKVKSKFFESITFLSHGYTPNADTPDDPNDVHSLIYQASTMNANPEAQKLCATKQDWETWINFLFNYDDGSGKAYNLDALEEAVAAVKQATNDPNYKVGVKIAYYPPISIQDDWGTLPGGDHSLNFKVSETNSAEQALKDRMAATKWYIDTVISMFEAKGYNNIRLDGFYWYDEVMHFNIDPLVEQTAKGVTDYVHSLNNGAYQIYWIPFYQSSGFRAWKNFGFDYAIMQPNYAFDAHASAQRIADTAALCKKYGLGIEMEFGGISDKYISQFREYLKQGADDQLAYQNNSLIAWYTGTWAIYETSKNVSDTRYIYDSMYDFFKGIATSMEKPNKNLAANSSLTLKPAEIKDQTAFNKLNLNILTDGNEKTGTWGTNYIQMNRNTIAKGPFQLTSDLGGIAQIERIALDFIDKASWGIGSPDSVKYSVSQDGKTWTDLATIPLSGAKVNTLSTGFKTVDFVLELQAPVNARYIKAEFDHGMDNSKTPAVPYAWMGFDEFTVNGVPPRASGEGIAELGSVTLESENIIAGKENDFKDRQTVASILLNDGKLQTGSWANVNTVNGDYVGLLQGIAKGPYTIQLKFDTVASIETLGVDFLNWASAGVGSPDSVTYYSSLDGVTWNELGTVTKKNAKFYSAIAAGMDAYHFVLENKTPVRAKYVKAVFERGFNTDKNTQYGWVAFDEFTATGTLTSEQPHPEFNAVDTTTGVTISGGLDVVPEGSVLSVKPLVEGNAEFDLVKLAFKGENVMVSSFDISLLLNGAVIQPNKAVTIGIPIPNGFDSSKVRLYHIDNSGVKTEVAITVKDGFAYAEVPHFSIYALVQTKADSSSSSDSGNSSSDTPSTTPSTPPSSSEDSSNGSSNSSSDTSSNGPSNSSSNGSSANPVPPTGDHTPITLPIMVIAIAVIAMASMIFKKCKE